MLNRHSRILIATVTTLAVSFITVASLAETVGWKWNIPASGQVGFTQWMAKGGWDEQRGDADAWRIKDGVLITRQNEDSTTVGTKRGFPLDATKHSRLSFSYQIDDYPAKGNVARKNTEDSALRVFVLFDRGGGILSPPDTLGYTVGSTEQVGKIYTSERFDQVKHIVVGRAKDGKGKWTPITRDVAADYRAAFGRKDVPKIAAIGIKSDGNNTDAKAGARIKNLRFTAP